MTLHGTNFVYYGLDETTKSLIGKVCGDTPYVELAPLDKGLSGSLTLIGRWPISGAPSKFHVFKVGDAAKLKREYEAITKIAAPLVRNFPNVGFEVSDDGSRGVLSQEFMGDSDGHAQSLKQFIERANCVDDVVSVLNRLYSERIIHWIPSAQPTTTSSSFGHELAPWLKKADWQKALVEVGKPAIAASVLARFTLNVDDIPQRVMSISHESVNVCRGPVHGDLHAQNVILDGAGRMSLIDFGWTGIRWRAVDYVWLECSLKFVVCSPYAQIDDLLFLDDALDNAWQTGGDIDVGLFGDKIHGESLAKIAAGISVIRRFAREQTPSLDLNAYRKVLTLMSYSLTTFPQLNRVYLVQSIARNISLIPSLVRDSGPYDRLYGATEILWPDRPGRMVRRAVAISPPGRALDLGCGDGKNIVYLEDNGWTVTGVDISGLAIAAIKKRIRRYYGYDRPLAADVVKCDVADYGCTPDEYDLVVAYGLYHCLADHEVMAVHQKIMQALKPGGLFAFATFNDTLPVPDGHETGDLYLRPVDHIFGLVGDSMEIVVREIGEIEEFHAPLVGLHRHGLTWALFRKK